MANRRLSLIMSVLAIAAVYAGPGVLTLKGLEASAKPAISMRVSTSAVRPDISEQRCGRQHIFGRPFSIEVTGKPIQCKNVRRIVASNCRIRLNRKWSCISRRENKSFLVWFLTAELFEPKLTTIRFRRYPCSKAHVTPRIFEHHSEGFPTRRQMLADDLIRCKMLMGASIDEIESTIGLPDEHWYERNRTYFAYFLGPTRGSLVQIDPELLGVEISDGTVQTLFFFQG